MLRKISKIVVFLLLVVVVGGAGLALGQWLGDRFRGNAAREVSALVPASLLDAGMAFPDVALSGAHGEATRTGERLPDNGVVVLFLDMECPPCVDMATRWQRALDEGAIDDGQLYAVTYHRQEVIDRFAEMHGLTFPIYRDAEQTFRSQFEVDRFPLQVVVGRSGMIRGTSYDSTSDIDFDNVYRQLED